MRKIKFRVWSIFSKKMFDDGFYLSLDGDLFENDDLDYKNKSSFEIMQYTGLKDKNGKEIYEGDIVKYLDRNMNNAFGGKGEPWEEKTRVVKWFNDGWLVPKGFVKEIEVIGNIYEDGDLLESK